jgi:PilZ domain
MGLGNLLRNRGWCDSAVELMTHFPQPHPSRRAARVQLGDSVLAAIRLEDGRRTKANLKTISATGGLLRLAQSLVQGDFVEVAFQTQAGPVHGMAEVLSPMRKTDDGVLQAFRFVAIEDDDHRRLRTSLDHVTRHLLGIKSSAFSTY